MWAAHGVRGMRNVFVEDGLCENSGSVQELTTCLQE